MKILSEQTITMLIVVIVGIALWELLIKGLFEKKS